MSSASGAPSGLVSVLLTCISLPLETVVRLTSDLDADERVLLRVSGGVQAREYLWALHHTFKGENCKCLCLRW